MDVIEKVRWETLTRYYQAVMYRDLLDDLVLTTIHGGKGSRLGGIKTVPYASELDAITEIEKIDRRRKTHGYRRI